MSKTYVCFLSIYFTDEIHKGVHTLGNCCLTLKQLGNNFFQNVILFSNVISCKCNISVSNWSNTMNIYSTLWILMAWCFSTRASVITVLSAHPCVSSYLWVNPSGDHFTKKQASFQSELAFTFATCDWLVQKACFQSQLAVFH